jgi:hypothetical protein
MPILIEDGDDYDRVPKFLESELSIILRNPVHAHDVMPKSLQIYGIAV